MCTSDERDVVQHGGLQEELEGGEDAAQEVERDHADGEAHRGAPPHVQQHLGHVPAQDVADFKHPALPESLS